MASARIRRIDATELEARLDGFTELLHAAVHAGASVNFIMPFPPDEARAFWTTKALPAVAAGRNLAWIAEVDGRVAGTVQLILDMPPNQPHRCEVTKLLVHPDFRNRGLARALMSALEAEAAARRRTLVTLDTRTGDKAEPLYLSMGYRVAGTIPGFCLDPFEPRLDSTTIMYKPLAAPA
ncbi:MAG: GNAT family N-acetyltransferase [Pseudomonadota bacterium]|nr:GNAT family N-acetyltransferase [Pseudomonadota bacterium]